MERYHELDLRLILLNHRLYEGICLKVKNNVKIVVVCWVGLYSSGFQSDSELRLLILPLSVWVSFQNDIHDHSGLSMLNCP